MHRRAKAVIHKAYDLKKAGNQLFTALPQTMEAILRVTVGEHHWKEACHSLKHNDPLTPKADLPSWQDKPEPILDSEVRGRAAFLHFLHMTGNELV